MKSKILAFILSVLMILPAVFAPVISYGADNNKGTKQPSSNVIQVSSEDETDIQSAEKMPGVPANKAVTNISVKVSGTVSYDDAMSLMNSINTQREKNGYKSFAISENLSVSARQRAAELAVSYNMQRPNRSDSFSVGSYLNAVIIGKNYDSAEELFEGIVDDSDYDKYLKSNTYKSIGAACFYNEGSGYRWVIYFSTTSLTNQTHYGSNVETYSVSIAEYDINLSSSLAYKSSTQKQFKIYIKDTDSTGSACLLDYSCIDYFSGNTNIASIDKYGLLTLKNSGNTFVRAGIKNYSDKCVFKRIENSSNLKTDGYNIILNQYLYYLDIRASLYNDYQNSKYKYSDDFETRYKDLFDREYICSYELNYDLKNMYDSYYSGFDLKYSLVDINSDGIDELIIGSEGSEGYSFYDAFTIKNGVVKRIYGPYNGEGSGRWYIYIYENGLFGQYMRDGTGYYYITIEKFNYDDFSFDDYAWLSDEYDRNSGSQKCKIKYADGTEKTITEDQFCAYMENTLPIDRWYDFDEEPQDLQETIVIYSTEKSMTVEVGKSFNVGFGLYDPKTKTVDENWKKMAVVISDPSIISISDYEKDEYGYFLDIIGKKEGSTNVTASDTETGASTSFTVTVKKDYVESFSYSIENMREFYPQNIFENKIKTNIYNLNGLYVNNYSCSKTADGKYYNVNFNVFNSKYYYGAVDVYDADGLWIESEEIDKFEDISSLKDTAIQAFYLISDPITGKLFTYEQNSYSKKTEISLKIPVGGYFVISNNMAESQGVYLANSLDILFSAASDIIEFATSKPGKTEFAKLYEETTKSFAQQIIDSRNESSSKEIKKTLMKNALGSMTKKIKGISNGFSKLEIKDQILNGGQYFFDISCTADNILKSYKINWQSALNDIVGYGESVFIDFAGPFGLVLKAMFKTNSTTDRLLQAVQMSKSLNNTYVTVFSDDSIEINPYGITIDTKGNVDNQTVLQVFKISDDDSLTVHLNSEDPLSDYEIYNICLVKNDKLVQPTGKVKVYLPIPSGMNGNTCKVYRRESNGAWSILDAWIEGNYLVFETDHFSFYAIIGSSYEIAIQSLPAKKSYYVDDTLETTGLNLSQNGKTITSGYYCEPMQLTKAGTQTINVNYLGHIVSFDVSVEEIVNPFTDVPENSWYTKPALWCNAKGYISGTSATTFAPNNKLTRAQFVQILAKVSGDDLDAVPYTAKFTDVPNGKWYTKAVMWCVANGVTGGTSATTFTPDGQVTREQLATFFLAYAKSRGYDVTASANLSKYTDAGTISNWAKTAVQWAIGEGLISGTTATTISPKTVATRAQAAVIFKNFVEGYVAKQGK